MGLVTNFKQQFRPKPITAMGLVLTFSSHAYSAGGWAICLLTNELMTRSQLADSSMQCAVPLGND